MGSVLNLIVKSLKLRENYHLLFAKFGSFMMWLQKIGIAGIILVLSMAVVRTVNAQVSMDVEVDEALSNSQSVNIQSLIANNGKGPTLFRMYLQNNTSEYVNGLYFRFIIESDKIGRIVQIDQVAGQPFSLSPNQQVFATNNNIGDGLPGVEELIQFDGQFSQEGKEFVNRLEGSTYLPADQYRITIEIHKGSAGGELLASESAEIGMSIVEDTRDFYLLSPGDVMGSEAVISNSFPNFQWQGTNGVSYRLLVVEAKGNDSPQSLMEGAVSTSPLQVNGSPNGGSLVDYEMLDVIVNQSSFQYPNAGVQSLEPGKQYYWRIIGQLETSSGQQGRESEIWSFKLADNRVTDGQRSNDEVSQSLRKVLGERFEQYVEDGYNFQSIIIDGETYQGGQALQKLMELGRQAEQGDISIVIEE